MTPRQKRNRRRPYRRCSSAVAIRPPSDRPQARPCDPSGEAEIIEPGWFVLGDTRRQDLGFPGASRRLEPFELADDRFDGVRPFHLGVGRDPLPAEQEAQEVARGDRLDLRAQSLDRVAVDACEEPALAPFVRHHTRREAAAHGETFGFERQERWRDFVRIEPERSRERIFGDRPQTFEPTAQDFRQRLVARPVSFGIGGRDADRGVEPSRGPERLELR